MAFYGPVPHRLVYAKSDVISMSGFIEGILRRMSVREKVGQLNHPNAHGGDTTGAAAVGHDIELRIRRGEVGLLAAGSELEQLRQWQRIAIHESPHGIPLLLTMDVIHGHRTVFPLPIGLACTWDQELVRRTARVAALEAAACGVALAWAPMLDVSRDARWGRCAESPGEDPLLGCRFAQAMVTGYQDPDLTHPGTLMATAKHFAGYGLSEAGRDYHAVDVSAYRMHNVILPPFKAAIDAGVGAIMVGFHDLNGIPCTAHVELLQTLLRGAWQFDGLVVSDYTAIMELVHHGVAATLKDAARLAFNAGVDIDLISEAYLQHLPDLVAEGAIAESALDAAVRRVLRAKQRLGLFDYPYRGLDAATRSRVLLQPAHRELARTAAARAAVLLKNDGVLPLAPAGTIALIGPLADSRENMQGTWAVAARAGDSVTVREGITAALGARGQVLYAKGANILDDPDIAARLNVFDPGAAIDPRSPATLRRAALRCARKADVIVACLGESKEFTGESASRTTLDLPGAQASLLAALAATGKPLVLVTMSGRPLALTSVVGHANAILHTWFGGSEAGHAIADLLFGVVNPSGKLAMSFPRDAGQCPIYYAEAPTGRPVDRIGMDAAGDREVDAQGRHVFRKFTTACRLEGPHTPLFPFGHGLSYTQFEYTGLTLEKACLRGPDDRLRLWLTVHNTGPRHGEEVVQLYLGDPVGSRSRPVRALKAFARATLAPGARRRVEFELTAADVQYFRGDALGTPAAIWEPGTFIVHVGPDSQSGLSASFRWLAA